VLLGFFGRVKEPSQDKTTDDRANDVGQGVKDKGAANGD